MPARGRTIARPIVGSLALHAVLVAALANSKFDDPKPTRILTVELLQMENGRAARTGRDSAAPDAAAATSDPSPPSVSEAASAPGARLGEERRTRTAPLPAAARAVALPTPPRLSTPQPPPRPQPPLPERPRHGQIELGKLEIPAPQIADLHIGLPQPAYGKPALDAPAESEPVAGAVSESARRSLLRHVDDLGRRLETGKSDVSLSWSHRGQEFEARVIRFESGDSTHVDHLVVAVRTRDHGQALSTKLQLKRMAFSSFAQFVDYWNPLVQIHDDRIDGRFHSNSKIYVSKLDGVEPHFSGEVTTAQDVDTTYSEGFLSRRQVFAGGLETHVRPILLPRGFEPALSAEAAARRVRRFDRDARIRFFADGSFGWRYLDSAHGEAPEERDGVRAGGAAGEARQPLPDEPFYLIGADKAELHVEGVVNGKVMVFSPRDIIIDGDLTYAVDPAIADSDDYLGLVADRDVEIAKPSVTGPGDLRVQASIYARRQFIVRDYGTRSTATLEVYGSLTAGSLTATEPRYRTKLEFDKRFEEARPPGFPMTDHYEVESWNGKWSVDDGP